MKNEKPAWLAADLVEAPDADTVHIFRTCLLHGDTSLLRPLLSADELARADRFVFEDDRRRFTVARAVLRQILGMYLDASPGSITFQYGEHGRPKLARPGSDLTFNLSHSGDLAVYAFARSRQVGIDAEATAAGRNPESIAERFFTAGEQKALRRLSPEKRKHGFVTLWTRKEAYLKACGHGLFSSPDTFETTLDIPPRIVSIGGDAEKPGCWTLVDLAPMQGYVAALVTKGRAGRIDFYDWAARGA